MALIPITGGIVEIDDEDIERVSMFNWYVHITNPEQTPPVKYAGAVIGRDLNGKQQKVLLHRFIMNIADNKIKVDHRDGDGLNNKKKNLRIATQQQNNQNQRKGQNNKSGFKGVSTRGRGAPRISGKPWDVYIGFNRKVLYIDSFETPEEAAVAYDNKAREMFGEFARVNFPREGEIGA